MKDNSGWINKKILLDRNSKEKMSEISSLILKELEKNHKNFLEDMKAFPTLENENYNSPLTVFNGKWGSGKTYYIKQLIDYFNSDKCNEKNYFKNVEYIDGLDIMDDNEILYSFLLKLYNKNSKARKKIVRHAKKVVNVSYNLAFLVKKLSVSGPIDWDGRTKERKKFIDKSGVKSKSKVRLQNKTIVFIDNLDRMENESMSIIRLLYKLRKVENLYFVIVTNLEYLEKRISSNLITEENQIVKFLNTPGFEFEQDYSSLLNGMNNTDVKITDN